MIICTESQIIRDNLDSKYDTERLYRSFLGRTTSHDALSQRFLHLFGGWQNHRMAVAIC